MILDHPPSLLQHNVFYLSREHRARRLSQSNLYHGEIVDAKQKADASLIHDPARYAERYITNAAARNVYIDSQTKWVRVAISDINVQLRSTFAFAVAQGARGSQTTKAREAKGYLDRLGASRAVPAQRGPDGR